MAPEKQVVTFDGFFEVSFLTLKFAGWRPNQEKAPQWHKFYCWISFCVVIAPVLNGAVYLVKNLGGEGKFLEVTDAATGVAIGSFHILKAFITIFTCRNEKALILDELEDYLRDSETKVSKDEINQTMQKFRKFWRVVFVLNFAGIALLSSKSLIVMLHAFFTQSGFKYQTPFRVWYPFEDSTGLAWIIVNLLRIWAAFASLLFAVGFDSTFSGMTTIVCLKFSELKQEIRMAKTAQELKHCIAAHVDLIEMSEKLSRIYQPAIFINFFIASVTICLAGFQSMAAGNADLQNFLSACSMTMLQCYLTCHYAERLRESSGSIAAGAFESIWRNKDQEMTDQISMIILRAQRPQHFKAFLFGRANLMVFTVVVHALYSYYSLLRLKHAGP